MALEFFTDDVEVISKLGDDPNIDDGLSADDLKAKFDDGPRLIKKFINEYLIPAVNEKLPSAQLDSAIDKAMAAAKESGAFDGGYYTPRVSESHSFPNGERTMNLAFAFDRSDDSLEEIATLHVPIPIGNMAYFATLPEAIEAINSNSNAAWPKTTDAEDTSVGVVKVAGQWLVTLYADMQISEVLTVNVDLTLNLNGHTLTLANDAARLHFAAGTHGIINGGTGKVAKTMTDAATSAVMCITTSGASLTIEGGSYELTGDMSQSFGAFVVVAKSNQFTMNGAKIIADNAGSSGVTGVSSQCTEAVLRNSDIRTNCSKGTAQAVLNYTGDMDIRDCSIFADAANQAVIEQNGMTSLSYGLSNHATVRCYNSKFYGTHSGMQTRNGSRNYVAGCYLESSSHGGVYISTGPDGIFYAVDSTFRCDYYKGKNDVSLFTTGVSAGFYVGGTSGSIAYMDRCAIYSNGKNPFVLRGTDGETDLALYLSNCTISGEGNTVRIDDGAGHAYIGAGCNISTATPGVEADKVSFTDGTYRHIIGDWGIPAEAIPDGEGGNLDPEAIKEAVSEYLDENGVPVDPVSIGAIPAPEAAEPGQTIVVKAVDGDGRPTEWKAVDLPSGGSAEWKLVANVTVEEDVDALTINTDMDGNPINASNFSELFVRYKLVGLGSGNYADRFTNLSIFFGNSYGGGTSADFAGAGNGYDTATGSIHAIYPKEAESTKVARLGHAHHSNGTHTKFEAWGVLASANIRTAAGIKTGSQIIVYGR